MKRTLLLLLFALSLSYWGWGQTTIYLHDFGTTTISSHPYTVLPVTFATNLSNSSWTNSNSAWTSFAGSSGQAISLNNSSGTPTITLTFSIASGYKVSVTQFNFWRQRSTSGAQNWSMTINGTSVGSGTVPTTGAAIGATNVSNTISNLTTTVTVVLSLSGASGTGTFRLDDFQLIGTVEATGNTSPILSTPTSSNITNTTATLGATISSNGGIAVTESGIVYGTSASPTGNATQTSPLVTSGAYTVNVGSPTALDPQTLYYYRGYAINTVGTGYSTDGTFRTLSNPPTAQASNLTGTPNSSTSINLTWTSASFPVSGATTKGYVLLRATSPNTPSLGNGNGAAPSAGTNTTIVSSTIAYDATSQSSGGLTANTTYNYLLIPFCWDGTNATTYNYLTTSAPTTSAATPSNLSDVVGVASSESATISSLINDEPTLSSTTGVQVWQITVRDGGSAMNDGDNLPTIVSGITLSQNTGNAVDNWSDAIKTIALFDGNTWIANASSITSTTIVFSGLNINVADNNSKTFSLRLSLNSTLNNVGSGNLDGDDFVFNITNANFSTLTDGTSSTKASFTTASSTNGQNVLSVVATKLIYGQQPTNVTTNTNISPAVTVKAVDAGNNTDRDFASSVSITSTGSTLTGSPVTSAAALGIATFSTLQLSDAATGVTLTASYAGLTDAISNSFNVSLPLSAYSYRTLRTGNWNGVSAGSETWERTSDGSNWSTVTSSSDIPNSSAGSITIKSGHTITVSSSTNADELTVESSGQITISSGQTFTIANGTGTDATINGYLKNSGTLTNNGQITFGNGSTYEHNKDGGTIPISTWDQSSTLLVSGVSSTIPTFSSSQTYGNVTWNCANHSGTLNLSGALRNIAGNLTISNTNSNILRLTGSTGYEFTIGGNLSINSSTSTLQIANGTSSGNILNIGSWNQTNGTFATNTGTSIVAINFTGSNGTFTQSAGTLTNTYINWTINNGASLTIASSLPVASSRSLTVNGTLICGETEVVSGAGAFILASAATLKTANTSGLNGSLTISGTKTLNTGANYEFNGSSSQVTGTLLPTIVNNLSVSGGSDLTISNAGLLTVSGALNIGTSSKLTVGSNQSLTVAGGLTNTSGASGLVVESGGSLKQTSAGVSATVKRTIDARGTVGLKDGWHFLSSPVASQAFQPNFVSTSHFNYEDFYLWDEVTNYWINSKTIVGTDTSFNTAFGSNFIIGKAYLAAYKNTSTKQFVGTLNYADQNVGLTSTDGSGRKGWNLIGNPYPCSVTWNSTTWGGETKVAGVAKVVLSAGGSYNDVNANDLIAPMNGIFVHTTAATTLTIPAAAMTHGGTWYKDGDAVKHFALVVNDLTDKTFQYTNLRINPASTNSYDYAFDGEFVPMYAPKFYSIVGENKLSTNSLPELTNETIIDLGFEKNEGIQYQINAEGVESMGATVYLTDLKTGVVQNLNSNPSYSFTAADGDDAKRFKLTFGSVGIDDPTKEAIHIFTSGNQLYIQNPGKATLEVFSMTGQRVMASQIKTSGLYQTTVSQPTGYYVVRLTNAGSTQVSKVFIK